MRLKEILEYIPKAELDQLSVSYKVDHQVKKLHGQTMFQLLLFSILKIKQNSLRVMEEFYHSLAFKNIANTSYKGVKYNSIRDRLVSINPDYFEAIFNSCLKKYQNKYLKKEHNIISFDSTIVTISSKLLKEGMQINKQGDKKSIKFSIAFSNIPVHSKIFTKQSFVSEDFALKELINECPLNKDNILVFDRGIQSRATFEEFSERDLTFITRLNNRTRYDIVNELEINQNETEKLLLEKDLEIILYDRMGKKTKKFFRLIIAKEKESGESFYFLTNNKILTTKEVVDIYKQRWEIEVFFKFIKQNLNFSHLLSRDENGVKVIMYMTLITAILLIVYKNLNELKGYKIPKLKFAQELEVLIIKDIVKRCGGDPNGVNKILNPD
ncbi:MULTISPECIES: IS4 family transposase [Flavobacterium]|uniref:IS4 family transposase n=1 Tax=Flavobacterium columnare TaxID=996 RepID=A0AA94F466_9FLAO|nr:MULTISPECIES: IS4 family transposase [Flavobacterium]MCH4829728.1 IS4 family transposase [Flavobacterium columnare]MCH4829740.1 IS4 family transposase [Flavobacterium columnare]MCH4831156.1 IS4 family transposase [Flavobacterium columnare]MCH4831266.1 IS4 family transposase [Flavobacterium columnare]MCH4831276.1 IS4 family transposase [Flavobacterium columnare]